MLAEWAHYLLRMFHLIAGIMWIGTSFYFVWLDSSFEPPTEKKEGVAGETYMVHGGFFYRVEKQFPRAMPRVVHWFKYEALLTWVSGVFLLGLVYWWNAGIALVDPVRFPMSPTTAMVISIGSLVVPWGVYDLLWKLLGRRAPAVATVLSLALLFGVIYGLCAVFPGRTAFIHVGAVLGTIMVSNVWIRILPPQRRMIHATLEGKEPDWAEGRAAKQRSMHNSYMTLPVLAAMISNHFSFAFDHSLNWLVLCVLAVVGASTRHLMITLEVRRTAYWAFAPTLLGVATLVALTMPHTRAVPPGPRVTWAEANDILVRRCRTCHSRTPTDDVFRAAPSGIVFDDPASVQALAPRIRLRAVEAKTMPFGNKTQITERERATLGRWIDQGASLE